MLKPLVLRMAALAPLLLAACLLASTAGPVRSAAPATTVVSGLGQVNHLLVDGDTVYWAEATPTKAKLRKRLLSGGPITDLLTEKTPDLGQFISYVHLQQSGDRLYFSRLGTGVATTWNILSIPKAGGTAETLVPSFVSVTPSLTDVWRITGGQLILATANPGKVNLPDNTRLAALDLETRVWRPILHTPFQARGAFITAVTDTRVYVRGLVANADTETGYVDLTQGSPNYTSLLHVADTDTDADEPGAVDETNLYFWSRFGGNHRLRRLALVGGTNTQLLSTAALGHGLRADGGNLYYQVKKNVFRLPSAGGSATKLYGTGFETASIGGLALDETSVYPVSAPKQQQFNIVSVAK
jgi:hypothetical protein